jgi:hypothetical protein
MYLQQRALQVDRLAYNHARLEWISVEWVYISQLLQVFSKTASSLRIIKDHKSENMV